MQALTAAAATRELDSRDSAQGWLMAAAARNADAAGPPLDAMSADAASGLLCHRSGWEVTLVAAQIHLGSLLLTAEREGEWRTKRVEARLDKGVRSAATCAFLPLCD